MVEHQSKEVVDKISDELKIQPALDLPRELMDKLQLVYNVNPIRNPNVAAVATAANATATVFTTPTDRDFFLISMSLFSNGGAAGSVDISIVIGGERKSIGLIQTSTTDVSISNDYNFPIKLDRGSTILIESGAIGLTCSAAIVGFTTDPQ